MVLPYSRHLFVRPAVSMTQRAWTEAHVAAFEFFGGSRRRLIPDNLKAGVCKPDLYDPKINRGYAELASSLRVPGRPGAGLPSAGQGRRSRRTSGISGPASSPGAAGRSLAAMTADAEAWCTQVAGQRRPRPLEGRTVLEVFAAEEAAVLRPLPEAPFEPATWSRPRSPRTRTWWSAARCIRCPGG